MLHTETVSKATFSLIQKLCLDPELKDFTLIGGTALALHLGHRSSIDIDLCSSFTGTAWTSQSLPPSLKKNYGFVPSFISHDLLMGKMQVSGKGIKVDFSFSSTPCFINKPLTLESIRLASLEDIVAMKLQVVAEGKRQLKDFFDIAALTSYLSFAGMMEAHGKRYRQANQVEIIRKLTQVDTPLKGNVMIGASDGLKQRDVQKLVERIVQMVSEPNRVFVTPVISRKLKIKL